MAIYDRSASLRTLILSLPTVVAVAGQRVFLSAELPAGYDPKAVTTNPATATTGDVRGTYALQGSASNGTRRLVMLNHPTVGNIGTAAGLAGVPQFSDF